MDSNKKYLKILELIGMFQILEAVLKIYIGVVYTIIRMRVKDVATFNYSHKDVENFPLEKLITIFRKLNSNKDLHKRLNSLKEQRNFIAHKGVLAEWFRITDGTESLKIASNQIEEISNGLYGGNGFTDYDAILNELKECERIIRHESEVLVNAMKSKVTR